MVNSKKLIFFLVVHQHALDDLERIWLNVPDVAADIEVFLEALKDNQNLLDRLSANKYFQTDNPSFSVEVWSSQRAQKRNLWRIKRLHVGTALAQYRVIYAFHPQQFRYYVLGIVHRDFNYDQNHPIAKRIIAAYDALDIPRY